MKNFFRNIDTIARTRRTMTLALLMWTALLQSGFAQSSAKLDTIYTPPGYFGGPLWATVYMPSASNGIGVVLTHGYTGNRQTLNLWCDSLAANGFIAMTIDYHDWSNSTYGIYPNPIREHKLAVEFLRRNASRFGITTNKIAGLGQSEGASHWAETIIWDNDDAYFNTDPGVNDRLDAVVLLYGLYDNYRYLQSGISFNSLLAHYFSPDTSLRSTKGNALANIARITTPILMYHGSSDLTVQVQQSLELNDSLVAHGKSVVFKLLNGQPHLFEYTSSTPTRFTSVGLIAKDTVVAFLRRTLQITGVADTREPMPKEFVLEQNYPNPFNPITEIRFQISDFRTVTLKIYTMLGEEVATIVNGQLPPGEYTWTWDASDVPSGVYYYRLTAGAFVDVKKMILMK